MRTLPAPETPSKTSLPSPIPEPLVEMIAARFQLLSEPMRVRILDLLRTRGEASVGEICEGLDTTQQNASRHLVLLDRGDIVGRRKQGNRVLYSIADESVLAICEVVCGSLSDRALELNETLEAVR